MGGKRGEESLLWGGRKLSSSGGLHPGVCEPCPILRKMGELGNRLV
jgi:hypothetical protein